MKNIHMALLVRTYLHKWVVAYEKRLNTVMPSLADVGSTSMGWIDPWWNIEQLLQVCLSTIFSKSCCVKNVTFSSNQIIWF